MTTKLYTVDNGGVEREINVQSQVLELNPSDNPPSEHYLQAMNGWKDVELSCVVSYNEETYKFLHKQHVMALALRAAIWKLRKSCRNCRWLKLERTGTNSHCITSWYCKFKRHCYNIQPEVYYCEHFRRKCKSKP